MKYCVEDYTNLSDEFKNEVDEITIYYQNQITPELVEFFEQNKEKRINLYIEDADEFFKKHQYKAVAAICEKYPEYNISLQFEKFIKEYYDEYLSRAYVPFYYRTRVNNWDTLQGLVALGVSDIYIVEDLCFELPKVSELMHSKNIQVRAFPNVAQSTWDLTSDLKKFFIRPEDISVYENYIDVLEFFGPSKDFEIYYKIYTKDQKWFGKLNEIIIGFNSDLDSRFIIPNFAESRVKCGKNCMKGGKCQICDRIEDLSHNLEASNFIVKTEIKNK